MLSYDVAMRKLGLTCAALVIDGFKKKRFGIVLSFMFLLGCAEPIDLGSFDEQSICKAVIATIMGTNPSIIEIDQVIAKTVFLSYLRADNTHWSYRCKLEGSRAIWASSHGRWRTHPMDAEITFYVEGNSVKIVDRAYDGDATFKYFSLERLSQ